MRHHACKVLFHGQAVNTVECGCHLLVKLFENLFLGPEIIHIALNLFEVTAGDPPALQRKSGIRYIPLSLISSSLSGVVGPLAPSHITLT